MQAHPDMNPALDTTQEAVRLNEAYAVLQLVSARLLMSPPCTTWQLLAQCMPAMTSTCATGRKADRQSSLLQQHWVEMRAGTGRGISMRRAGCRSGMAGILLV